MISASIWPEHNIGSITQYGRRLFPREFGARINDRGRMNLRLRLILSNPHLNPLPFTQEERRKELCAVVRRVRALRVIADASPFARERVRVRSAHLSRNVNISSASETMASLTTQ